MAVHENMVIHMIHTKKFRKHTFHVSSVMDWAGLQQLSVNMFMLVSVCLFMLICGLCGLNLCCPLLFLHWWVQSSFVLLNLFLPVVYLIIALAAFPVLFSEFVYLSSFLIFCSWADERLSLISITVFPISCLASRTNAHFHWTLESNLTIQYLTQPAYST